MRRFRSPSGREWTADVFELPPGVGVRRGKKTIAAPSVLRFMSADLTLDLVEYPKDWDKLTDEDLIALARRASPPLFAPVDEVIDNRRIPS